MIKRFFITSCSTISYRKYATDCFKFVPKCDVVTESEIEMLKEFIDNSERILVLTGAGISTESGIPDYRSADVGLYARTNHKPIQYQAFLKDSEARKRYWARNYVGWETFSKRQPNPVHYSLENLENKLKKVSCIVTQNVDNLHYKAGSKNVIELHGSAYRVICLNCDALYDRFDIQDDLRKQNPDLKDVSTLVRPDGDVEVRQEAIDCFKPPLCRACAGVLKPDIVFFGDNVPKSRVEGVKSCVSRSSSVLVLGTSLSVFSSYRVVLQALDEGKRVCVVNIGPTRADDRVDLKISCRIGDILPRIC